MITVTLVGKQEEKKKRENEKTKAAEDCHLSMSVAETRGLSENEWVRLKMRVKDPDWRCVKRADESYRQQKMRDVCLDGTTRIGERERDADCRSNF